MSRGLTMGLALAVFWGCAPKQDAESPPQNWEKQGDEAPQAKGSTPAKKGPAAAAPEAAPGDADAARALFDDAVRRQLAGDALGSTRAMIELAAKYPQTRHGRAASRRLGGGIGTIAVVGVLAAVAIPAFTKYINRSKSAEARMMVRKMSDAAVAFYLSERADALGNIEPARFPQSTPLSPSKFPCRGGDSHKHFPRPDDWSAPGWNELNFALSDPHYYRYQFLSKGTGDGAIFTARALGDLDCDGVLSTFERIGVVRDGQVDLGAGLFIENESE